MSRYEVVAVSAGFDTHAGDLASLGLSSQAYGVIGQKIGRLGKPLSLFWRVAIAVKTWEMTLTTCLRGLRLSCKTKVSTEPFVFFNSINKMQSTVFVGTNAIASLFAFGRAFWLDFSQKHPTPLPPRHFLRAGESKDHEWVDIILCVSLR